MNNIPACLTAAVKKSFAYATLKDRLPIIITKLIDHLSRDKVVIAEQYGSEAKEELKEITGRIAQLKNELVTDKQLTPLVADFQGLDAWNRSLEELANKMKTRPTWFASPWLFVETYLYRRIFEAFYISDALKNYDYFQNQKESSTLQSLGAMIILGQHLQNVLYDIEKMDIHLLEFLKIALWSNRCDLSLSTSAEKAQSENPVSTLGTLEPYILVDDSDHIIDYILNLKELKPNGIRVDIVLDNAGFELFCDFCLAHFLCATNLAREVHFYVKNMPWYVSDTMAKDIYWAIDNLKATGEQGSPVLKELATIWDQYVSDEVWIIESEPFWTLSYDYSEMLERNPELFQKLSEAELVIFKGDLNYRKLTGDRMWEMTTTFERALRGFHPTALCSLRTIKADTLVGLSAERVEEMKRAKEDWMVTGEYAVIQYCSTRIDITK